MKKILFVGAPATLLVTSALVALAQTGDIRVDGSSTVYPITLAVAEEFKIENPRVKISVAFSGTGGGFKKFCVGETDVSNASRPISAAEVETCKKNGIPFIEIPVAYDGLTVVVNPKNTFVNCLTVAELKRMWEPGSKVNLWSDVRPSWPKEKIVYYGAGSDSGTFDYFTEEINGKSKAIRTDYFPSEDDNVLVKGVEGNPNAIGFFGYAYYLEEGKKLKAVAIDKKGDGKCVLPNETTINNGSYSPLSRPLFIYVNAANLNKTSLIKFVEFYLNKKNRKVISSTGYVQLPERAYELALDRFKKRKTGTLFGGKLLEGKTLVEVLEGK
ncbi:MAG: PstS family phosphate ABC transporter substrate-binding protein [Deinococcales bacterium]